MYVNSAVVAPGLQNIGSIVLVHGLSFSMVCGMFPDQGSNPCLLHWQVDSLPLNHQGSTPAPNFHSYIWILLCTVMAISFSVYSTIERMISALKENRKSGQAGDRDIYP